jgi:hypothetical protein
VSASLPQQKAVKGFSLYRFLLEKVVGQVAVLGLFGAWGSETIGWRVSCRPLGLRDTIGSLSQDFILGYYRFLPPGGGTLALPEGRASVPQKLKTA